MSQSSHLPTVDTQPMQWNGLKHRGIEGVDCKKGNGPRERSWSIGKEDENWRADAS